MALSLIWQVIIWIGSSLLLSLFRPKIKQVVAPQPFVQRPDTDEDKPIPFGFGTFRVKPSILWWGDTGRVPYKEVISPASFFHIEHLATTAYDFTYGVWMGLCWGRIDTLWDIVFDDDRSVQRTMGTRTVTYSEGTFFGMKFPTGHATADHVTYEMPINNPGDDTTDGVLDQFINEDTLFGGRKSGGGLVGMMRFYWGNDGRPLPMAVFDPDYPGPDTIPQPSNAYLEGVISAEVYVPFVEPPAQNSYPLPAYPWLCYAVGEGMNWGEAQNMHECAFVLGRWPRFLVDTNEGAILPYFLFIGPKNRIGIDANGAEVAWELLTNPDYGLGLDPDELDIPSFCKTAWLLYEGGIGISGMIGNKMSVKSILDDIQRHCDFVIVYDQIIGKIVAVPSVVYLQEIGDIVATATDSNAALVSRIVAGWRSRVNEVKVVYTNVSRNFNHDIAQVEDLAQIEQSGERITEQVEYLMYTDRDAAQRMATRLLRELQGPERIQLRVNREFAHVRPGDRIFWTSVKHGIISKAYIIADADYGELDDGKIQISCVEDVFFRERRPYTSAVVVPGDPVNNNQWREPRIYPAKDVSDGPTSFPGIGAAGAGEVGILELGVDDPFDTIISYEFAPWDNGTTGAPVYEPWSYGDVPTFAILLNQKGAQRIYYRVTYTLEDGVTTDTIVGYVEFGPTAAAPPSDEVDYWTATDHRDTEPASFRVTSSDASVGIDYDATAGTVDLTVDTTGDGGSDGGAGTGQPGDRLIYFHVGYGSSPDHPVTNIPVGDTDIGLGVQRQNLGNAGRFEIQADVRVAGNAGSRVGIKFDTSEAGAFTNWLSGSSATGLIDLSATGVKLASADLAAAAKAGGPIFLKAFSTGGDASSDPAFRTLILRTMSATDTGPVGGTGNIILNLDARNVVQGDATSLSFWEDWSAYGNNAQLWAGRGQTAPTYYASGFNGGSLPRVRFNGGNDGMYTPRLSNSTQTWYLVLSDMAGEGGPGGGNMVSTEGDAGQNMFIQLQGNGRIYSSFNSSAFVSNAGEGAATDYTPGPRIIRIAWDRSNNNAYVYVDGVLDRLVSGSEINGLWINVVRMYIGNRNDTTNNLIADFAQVVVYDAAHITAGLNSVEDDLIAEWGL